MRRELRFLDIVSPRTIHTGSKGSIVGCLGTILLIILSIVLLVGPVTRYLNGDYYQCEFKDFHNDSNANYVSGVDIKFAVAVRNRSTLEYISAESFANIAQLKVSQLAVRTAVTEDQLVECPSDLFEGTWDAPQLPFCYTLPPNRNVSLGSRNGLDFGFRQAVTNDYSVSAANLVTSQDLRNFESDVILEVYYTSKRLDDEGNTVLDFHKTASN